MDTDKIAAELADVKPIELPKEEPELTNLYLDRVQSLEQVQRLLRADTVASALQTLAYYTVNCDMPYAHALAPTPSNRQGLKPFADYLKLFYAGWHAEQCTNIGGDRIVNERNWRHALCLLRYQSNTFMHTNGWRAANRDPVNGGYLIQVEFDGAQAQFGHWQSVPYTSELFTKFAVHVPPQHYLHLSPTDAGKVRFFANERDFERDRLTETTISKYVKKFWPHIPDASLQEIAAIHKLACQEDGVEFFDTPDDFVMVYDNGPTSCMTNKYAHIFGSHARPTDVYGKAEGVRLAAIRQRGDRDHFTSRAIVVEQDGRKIFIRCYGEDSTLQRKLERRGYSQGTWEGVRLPKIPALDKDGNPIAETYLGPYLDDMVNGNGGGPNSDSVQWVLTCPAWDHFVVGDKASLDGMAEDLDGGVVLAAGNDGRHNITSGLWGKWWNYHPKRHKFFKAAFEGRTYTEPRYDVFNENDEILCSNCGAASERIFVRPVGGDTQGRTHWWCLDCHDGAAGEKDLLPVEGHQVDGFPLYTFPGFLTALPREGVKAPVLSRRDLENSSRNERDPAKYIFVYPDEIENHGFVKLGLADGGYVVRRDERMVRIDENWVLRENLITTVLGETLHKKQAWFMGQNFSEALQYFPQNRKALAKAMKEGRLFLLGSKIEYDATASFAPVDRSAFFAAVGELDEEEDDEIQLHEAALERVPLVDFLSTLWASTYLSHFPNPDAIVSDLDSVKSYMQDQLYGRCSALWSRVHPDLTWYIVNEFLRLTEDIHAGLEGISRISAQVYHVLREAQRAPEEAFRNKRKPRAKRRPPCHHGIRGDPHQPHLIAHGKEHP